LVVELGYMVYLSCPLTPAALAVVSLIGWLIAGFGDRPAPSDGQS